MTVSNEDRASGQRPDRLARTVQSVLPRSIKPNGGVDDLVEWAFPILRGQLRQVVTFPVTITIGPGLR